MTAAPAHIILTAFDGPANGCIALARWNAGSEAEARQSLAAVDELIPEGAEGDMGEDEIAFLLDLHDAVGDGIDNNAKPLPMQIAMRIAPEQVRDWMAERPDPDEVLLKRAIPVLSGLPA